MDIKDRNVALFSSVEQKILNREKRFLTLTSNRP